MFVLWLILASWWLQQLKRVQSYTFLSEQVESVRQSSTKAPDDDQPAHSSTVSEHAPTVLSSVTTSEQVQPDQNPSKSSEDALPHQSSASSPEGGESGQNPALPPEDAQPDENPVIPPEDAEAVENPATSREDQSRVVSTEAVENPATSAEDAQPVQSPKMSSDDAFGTPTASGNEKHLVHFNTSGGSPPAVDSHKMPPDLGDSHGKKQSNILLIPKSSIRVIYGDMAKLPKKVRHYVEEHARLCKPETIHVCDGSDKENELLLYVLQREGILKRVTKLENCWLAKTDPADVARVERLTYISTTEQRDTIPTPKHSARCQLGNWMAPEDMEQELNIRFPNCMRGRTMFVIPFSMGPVGSPLSKIGIQLTDSEYVVASMRIMTRIGDSVLKALGNGPFVKCLHSVGKPLPLHGNLKNNWPCDPKMLLVAHLPEQNEICSFGSSYGGNALLGKKCLALRLGSILGHREGWLAEHMLILGVENTKTGQKKYIVAAFPSACGKTNLAMMKPTLPHLKVTCVGDDIAWMRFDDQGRLRAINPENGFFGVAPGTSYKTNPYAMDTIMRNTIFTNVAETSDGGVFWEGLEEELPQTVKIKSWLGDDDWSPESRDRTAAHPNSRFCTPASQCPIMDPAWEDPEGVPIDAIIFGGRRPLGVPLVYETFNWEHGVFTGASMRSESTAAAEHKAKIIMHDPFAMRPFFGYNFGDYLSHWLSFKDNPKNQLPKIFHVNWFRKDKNGKFLWPGFGENCRVLDWIMRRVEGEDVAQRTPVGFVPKPGSLDLTGLDQSKLDMETLMSTPIEFWENEVNAIYKYFDEQVNDDLPDLVMRQLKELENRVLGH